MAKYIPTLQATLDTYLQWRLQQQQLVRRGELDLVRTVRTCGWLPPAAGIPALALFVRGYDAAPGDLEKALKAGSLMQVRTVRGARMILERSMVPWAVAASGPALEKRWRAAWRAADVPASRKEAWRERILSELGNRERTREELLAALPQELTRKGDASFNRRASGHDSFFSLLLTEMEERGEVHEHLGRWATAAHRFAGSLLPAEADPLEARLRVIERFFAWGNVANAEDLAWWGGWPVRECEAILNAGELPLSHLVLAGSRASGLMVHSQFTDSLKQTKATREGPVFALPGRDPFFVHQPHLLERTAPEGAKIFRPHSVTPRPLVLRQGRPVAAWNLQGNDLRWEAVGRMDPTLRKQIDAVLARVTTWMKANLQVTIDD